MITELKEYEIRYSDDRDTEYLKDWIADPEAMRWLALSSQQEIFLYIRNWRSFVAYRSGLTATFKGEPYGMGILYLMPYKKVKHMANFAVVVSPKHRRKGIGTSLIKNLLNLAENYFYLESIYTEITVGCPLQKILEQFSFKEFAYQKNFVKDEERYFDRVVVGKFFK